jgi:predicted  nucleic acid-binding Zn-ribbon protein
VVPGSNPGRPTEFTERLGEVGPPPAGERREKSGGGKVPRPPTKQDKEQGTDVSIRDQIVALENLARLDADVRRIDEELSRQRSAQEQKRAEIAALDARIEADQLKIEEMARARGELTGELRATTQQVQRSREKLQRARNERESNAAQRELEELQRLVRDRTRETEKLAQLEDAATESITQATAQRDGVVAALEGAASASEGADSGPGLAQLQEELDARRAEREEAAKALPNALYRRYETVRTRRPNALASTRDGICGGCHLTVPPMMFQKMLRQEEFEQCPSCRRILYYTPQTPATPQATGS